MRPIDQSDPWLSALIALLNELITFELVVLQTYRAALREMEQDPRFAELLQLSDNHERHVLELRRCVQDLGGTPIANAEVTSIFGYRDMSLLAPLTILWSTEDELARAYEHALEGHLVVPRVRQVLTETLQDEHYHWAWLALQVEQEDRRQTLQ